MKPLFVLLITFGVSLSINRMAFGDTDLALPGKTAMSVMLLFTAIAHFAFTRGMEMMLPVFIPYKRAMVYLTGIIEIVAAVAILVPSLGGVAGWLLIAFFLLILPANIYAAMHRVDYQEAGFGGNGIRYLWFRIPLQALFIAWTYLFVVRG